RERVGALVARIPEPEALEQHAATFAPLGHPVEPPVELEVLEGGQLPVDERLVAEEADPLAWRGHVELARGRHEQPCDQAQQRGLAGPVRAGQQEERPSRDVEVEVADHVLRAERAAELPRRDDWTSTSASTKQKKARLITPFIVKKAASRRR